MGFKPWVTRRIRSTQAQLLIAVLLIVGISVWSAPYFSESVFYMHGDKFRLVHQDHWQATYRSFDGRQVMVLNGDEADRKQVRIEQQNYAVNVLEVDPVPQVRQNRAISIISPVN